MKSSKRGFLVGLTGGLGSGKTTVLKMFRAKGARTLDADQMVQDALQKPAVLRSIRQIFGSDVLKGPRRLNKKRLADLVFSVPRERKKLERLLHPMVRRVLIQERARQKSRITVCDVPLLFEVGWKRLFKYIVVVAAPLETRLKRLAKRGLRHREAMARMNAQWPLSRKLRHADFVIHNGGSQQETKKQVDWIWLSLHPSSSTSRGTHGIAARTKRSNG